MCEKLVKLLLFLKVINYKLYKCKWNQSRIRPIKKILNLNPKCRSKWISSTSTFLTSLSQSRKVLQNYHPPTKQVTLPCCVIDPQTISIRNNLVGYNRCRCSRHKLISATQLWESPLQQTILSLWLATKLYPFRKLILKLLTSSNRWWSYQSQVFSSNSITL